MKTLLLYTVALTLFGAGVVHVYNNDESATPPVATENLLASTADMIASKEVQDQPAIAIDNFRVPILVYHHIRDYRENESSADKDYVVPPSEFQRQMQYLHENEYTTILLRDIPEILAGNTALPKNPVILTFDDGRLDHYTEVMPILATYDAHATFFIFTNAIDRNANYLNSSQIREMHAKGHEIGSHTILHAYLTKADTETLIKETEQSKAGLEALLGDKVTAFAYPFGLYNDTVENQINQTGYITARTLRHSKEVSNENLLSLPGYIVTGDFSYFQAILNDKV